MEMAVTKEKQLLKERGLRLRHLRKMLKLTISDFANLCECGDSTIRQWEQGKASGLSRKGAIKICEKLKATLICDIEWLLEGLHAPPRLSQPPQTTTLLPIPQHFLIQKSLDEEKNIQWEMDYFNQLAIDPLVIRIQDNAMEPYFFKGDYIAGSRLYGNAIKQLVGKYAIVKTVSGLQLLRYINSFIGEKFHLTALNLNANTKFLTLETELISAALVTRLWRNSAVY
jgi:transcriptional regulator with XRE-family HTH domain